MIRLLFMTLVFACIASVPAGAEIYDAPESEGQEDQEVVPRYNPDREAARSLLLPGWSQYRQGHNNTGFAYSAIAAVTLVFALGVFELPILSGDDDNFGQVLAGVMYGLNAVVSGFDAHRSAVESNREFGWDLEEQAQNRPPGWRVALVRVRF